jgi:catechol 2,3-dioxygenase-like lactoylglutathione lyase family enzyme
MSRVHPQDSRAFWRRSSNLEDRIVGLDGVRAEIAMLQTPDGRGRLRADEIPHAADPGRQPARAGEHTGHPPIAFAVENIDAVVAGLRARGSELVSELGRYEDSYRLCYVRGPEGIIVELAERIG